jgi:phosphatidylethanolamine/phosphatidyl-N-methylethanolamine N-methyltransferase
MLRTPLRPQRDPYRDPYRGVFFRSWLRDPFHVASIAPSSRWLAKLMASGVQPSARIVELGAGTGTLTTALLDAGVRPENLFLVEQHAELAAVLRVRFPAATVVETDAAALTSSLGALRGIVDYVISGLPILWFNRDKKAAILEEAFALLKPTGRLHQFTYLGRPPIGPRLLAELSLRATLLGIAPMNLPPAFVYRLERVTRGVGTKV